MNLNVHHAKEYCCDVFLNKKNVVGVGEGQDKVLVFVTRKESVDQLNEHDVIPRMANFNVPTDVVEIGVVEAYAAVGPGDGVKHVRTGATGTLGCFVEDKEGTEATCILSNNHVIAATNQGRLDDHIAFQGSGEARLLTWNDIKMSRSANNRLDCAIAEVWDTGGQVLKNDPISQAPPINVPEVGTEVQKFGLTTGHTRGKVIARNVSVLVGYGNDRVARFEGQTATEGHMSAPGDSGSVLIRSRDHAPCGLLFAGSDQATFYNPMVEVLDFLDVCILDTSEQPEPEPEPEEECTEITIKIKVCGKAEVIVE